MGPQLYKLDYPWVLSTSLECLPGPQLVSAMLPSPQYESGMPTGPSAHIWNTLGFVGYRTEQYNLNPSHITCRHVTDKCTYR